MVVGLADLAGACMRQLRLNPVFVVTHLIQRRRDRGAYAMPGQSFFIAHAFQGHIDRTVADGLGRINATW